MRILLALVLFSRVVSGADVLVLAQERNTGRVVECVGFAQTYASGDSAVVVAEGCVPESAAVVRVLLPGGAALGSSSSWEHRGKKTFIRVLNEPIV